MKRLELIIVVVVLAIIAAVAVPGVARYLRRAQETEVVKYLPRIYDGVKDYYETHDRFPYSVIGGCDQDGYPPLNVRKGNNYQPEPYAWDDSCWHEVGFSIDEPIYFDYHCVVTGTGDPGHHTWMWAVADLDHDTTPAYWYVNASIKMNGEFDGMTVPMKSVRIFGAKNDNVY